MSKHIYVRKPIRCTNLKDSNGKIIYDGDRIVWMYWGMEREGRVYFDEENDCWKIDGFIGYERNNISNEPFKNPKNSKLFTVIKQTDKPN